MKFALHTPHYPIKNRDCLIIGFYETGELTPFAQTLNKSSQNYISHLIKTAHLEGKEALTYTLYDVPSIPAERIILVGCGKKDALSIRHYRILIAAAIKTLDRKNTQHVVLSLTDLSVENCSFAAKIKQTVEVISSTLYTFDQFKSAKKAPLGLQKITLLVPDATALKKGQAALKDASALVEGMTLTKDLANLPSNICTPDFLAQEAKKLAKKYPHLTVKVIDQKAMEKLGMGAFLAVAKGSQHPPKLICLEYKRANTAPIALVGKGITFDTGGLSLKPAESMVGMKYDMCGAATVLGTFKTIAEMQLPIHLIGFLAAAENMPSGHATKPEDIVKTLSGQTVEILNTDAEGRLVLCDTLTYAERYKPDTVIDIATLTGAVLIALGVHATGLLANNDELAADLLKAGNESFDRAWQLPLWEEFQEQLNSPFADMSNVGGRVAGTITAACFLSRFAKKFAWAHLDVAGTAAMMMGGNERFATGRPVPLLVQYLINRCENKKRYAKD